ncbi:MAG TPA: acyloxyacyl hydrolase [Verrucomicrobiae bacterium]
MGFPKWNSRTSGLAAGLAGGLLVAGQYFASAQQLRFDSAGLRAGVTANESGTAFHQVETVAKWDTPLDWDFGQGWWMKLQASVSAGWLGDPGHDAFIGTAGPGALLGCGVFPVTFEGGLSPTFLSQPDFGTKNLGSNAQFTSYAGLNFHLGSTVRLSYRFQHMSNAGLSSHNPGLNLHMFGVSLHF